MTSDLELQGPKDDCDIFSNKTQFDFLLKEIATWKVRLENQKSFLLWFDYQNSLQHTQKKETTLSFIIDNNEIINSKF